MDFILLPLSHLLVRGVLHKQGLTAISTVMVGEGFWYSTFAAGGLVPEQRSWFCSQSLSTLSVIEEFLAKRPMPSPPGSDGGVHNWVRNINYYSECSQSSSLLLWHCLILWRTNSWKSPTISFQLSLSVKMLCWSILLMNLFQTVLTLVVLEDNVSWMATSQ